MVESWLKQSCLLIVALLVMSGQSLSGIDETVTVSPDTLNLGEFRLGADGGLTGVVKVTNHTAERLRLDKLEVSCGCLRIVRGFREMDAGETKTISLRVDPENNAYPVSNKRLRMELRGDHVYRRSVKVRWKVVHPITAIPEKLGFTKMKPGERRTEAIKLRLTDDEEGEPFSIKNVHSSYPFVETEIIDDQSIRVEVTMPSDFEGKREPELVIQCEADGKEFPVLRLPLVVARVPREVLVRPKSISLFEPPPAGGKQVTLRLFRSKKQPLEFESVEVVNAEGDAATQADPRSAGSQRNSWLRRIELTIPRSEPGTREVVRIRIKEAEVDLVEVSIHHAYR